MTWSAAIIADAVCAGLTAHAQAEDLEQVVYGLDHLDELGLHPLIHKSLADAGLGVWPEGRYPGHWAKQRKSEGLRCDVVLTPDKLPLRDPEIRDTLFDQLPACDPEEAYWLEIKTVAQYEIGGPFRRYTSELLSSVAQDLKKLWGDGVICHGGLLLVLFVQSKDVADHDLFAWQRRCLDRGYPIGPSALRGFPIANRIGNAYCGMGMFAVRGA